MHHQHTNEARPGQASRPTIPVPRYKPQVDAMRSDGHWFMFFRVYYRILPQLDALFLQDLLNHAIRAGGDEDPEGWFPCPDAVFAAWGWKEKQIRGRFDALRKARYVSLDRRGQNGERFAKIHLEAINSDLELHSAPAQKGGTAPAQKGGTAPAQKGGTAPAQKGGTLPTRERLEAKDTVPNRRAVRDGLIVAEGDAPESVRLADGGPTVGSSKSGVAGSETPSDHQSTDGRPSATFDFLPPPQRKSSKSQPQPPVPLPAKAPGFAHNAKTPPDTGIPAETLFGARHGVDLGLSGERADTLRRAVTEKTQHAAPWKRSAWAADMNKLLADLGGDGGRLDRVLAWYAAHMTEEYVPVAYSAGAFRDKFDKIEAAMRRSQQPAKPRRDDGGLPRKLDPSELHAAYQDVYDAVKGLGWPKGSAAYLPELVNTSLKNYSAFFPKVYRYAKEHKDDPPTASLEVAEALTDRRGYVDFEIEMWLTRLRDRLAAWDKFSGDPRPFAWRHDSKEFFQQAAEQYSAYTCHPLPVGMWERFLAAIGFAPGAARDA